MKTLATLLTLFSLGLMAGCTAETSTTTTPEPVPSETAPAEGGSSEAAPAQGGETPPPAEEPAPTE